METFVFMQAKNEDRAGELSQFQRAENARRAADFVYKLADAVGVVSSSRVNRFTSNHNNHNNKRETTNTQQYTYMNFVPF